MRQRKVKNLEKKYEAYSDILVYEPEEMRGRWRELAREKGLTDIALEVGCGKGRFTAEYAKRHPETLLIAIEGNRSVMLRAMEKIRAAELINVRFIPTFIKEFTGWFEPGVIDRIMLNFSDPLPKPRTAKHRLTNRSKLRQYFTILSADGELLFKTDNDDLFDYSIREVLAEDLRIVDMTRDLHNSEFAENNIMTEYEEKFSGLGENINWIRVKRKEGLVMNAPESMAAYNGRVIPKEDKIFGISGRANKMIAERGKDKVINATIGTMLDDDGNLVVLSSVDKMVKALTPADYAAYAPIAGLPGFRKAIAKAAFGNYQPKGYVGVVATPGGTASIRNAVSNYTCIGDRVLTHDWHWGPYKNICCELGRDLEEFSMFDADGNFNVEDFEYKVKKLLRNQDRLLIILNTPGNNPTGYSLSDDDWKEVVRILNEADESKKIALLADVAYIDFAGDEDETRTFLPLLEQLKPNVLPMLAYSASKTFTFYGMRCAATICMAPTKEIADEFELVCSYSSRASWSNSPRGPQTVIQRIYDDPELLAQVDKERKEFRDTLLARGHAFEREAAKVDLKILPFRGGFFVTIPCSNSDAVGRALEEKGVFIVPFDGGGLRVSVASISEEKCAALPEIIKDTMLEIEK